MNPNPSSTRPRPPSDRRIGAWLLGALFVAVALAGVPTTQASTTHSLTIDTTSAGPQVAFKNFDGNPPKLFDIDGDGDLEIIAQNDNGWVYVFDSQSGAILAELDNTPKNFGARSFNGPEVAVLVDGGAVHLVAANSAAEITSYVFDAGASNSGNFVFHKKWTTRLNDCHSNAGMDAKPVFADLNNDGRFEIIGATEEFGVYALRHDGSLFWKNCLGGGNAAPGIGDLNQDGIPDVIHVSDSGVVAALDGRDGNWLWGFNVHDHYNLRSGSIPVQPGIGQLDGKGGPDIVVGARDSHDTEDYDNNHALLLALDSNGKILWGHQHPEANPLTYTRPIIVDADGDGENEVYWGDWNTVGHKGGVPVEDSWQTTGPANFYRYSAGGDLVWRQSLDTYWSNKDLALADVDGDGVQEVIVNGPGCGGDGIWYLDSRNGNKENCISIHPWKASRGVIVGDLRGDGGMQWVLEAEAASNEVSGGAILVYDTNSPYDAAWPHAPYPSVGPRGGDGGDDGASVDFTASFETPGGNAWWVEVLVGTNQPLAGVDARDDGGAWVALEKKSWGAWAKSFHVEDGSVVEFRARNAGGEQVVSQGHVWPSGEPAGDGGDGGGGDGGSDDTGSADFTASFETPGGNAWWVEVLVGTNQPLAGVDARDDGGAWVALEKKSWGAWAKSFHVKDGSIIEFRAISTDGKQLVSQGYIWPSGEPAGGGDGDEGASVDFTASFETPGGNAWWVEVYVDANQPVAGVAARDDGGAWVALEKKSWGAWAKSFHVADGSVVEFRATSTDGDTDVSGEYRWPEGEPV